MRTLTTMAVLTAAALLAPTGVRAACPDPANLCDCLGAAKNFNAVSTDKMTVSFGKISASGSAYRVPADVTGAVCGSLLTTIAGSADDGETNVGDVVSRVGPGLKAIKFKGVRVSGILDPGVVVNGDIVTGGGLVVSPELGGCPPETCTPDTTGTHPLLALCTQAVSDLAAAATTLAALTPTQTIDQILAKGGEDEVTVINTVPGLNVISTTAVKVAPKSVSGYPEGSELSIDVDAGATLVVINTGKLTVGKQSSITIGGAGTADVVINVTAPRGVSISQEASVDPVILATQSTVTVGANVEVSSKIYGRKVTIKGATVEGDVCSPSGAFLDDAEPLF